MKVLGIQHWVKIVQIRNNAGKYGPEINPYLDTSRFSEDAKVIAKSMISVIGLKVAV